MSHPVPLKWGRDYRQLRKSYHKIWICVISFSTCQNLKLSLGSSMLSKHYITLEPVLKEAVAWASTLSVLIINSVGLVQPRRLWTHLLFTLELPIKQNPLGESLLLPPEEPLQLAGDEKEVPAFWSKGNGSLRSLVYQHSSCCKN